MKKTKLLLGSVTLSVIGVVLVAADHIDAPVKTSNTADISDFYGFGSPSDADNTVFTINL